MYLLFLRLPNLLMLLVHCCGRVSFFVKEIQLTDRIDRYTVAVKVAICIRHFTSKVMVLRVCCFQGEVVPLAVVLVEGKGILTIDTVGPDVLYQMVLCT